MAANHRTLKLLHGMRVWIGNEVDAATADLTDAWARAWNELNPELDAAIKELTVLRADGQWPTRWQISRARRVQAAVTLARSNLDELARHSGIRVLQAVERIPATAAEHEALLIASQMPAEAGTEASLAVAFNRADPGALEAIVKRTTGQIHSLLKPLSEEAVLAMKSALVRGVALGDNPNVAAARMLSRMEGVFNGGLTRAKVIARTEMLDAHRAGGMAQDLANPEVVAKWQWICALDERTCPSCLAMHGSLHPIDEQGPNDHQQGRCARSPVTKSWKSLGFNIPEPESVVPDARAWFDQLPQDAQLRIMGPQRLELLHSGQVSWSGLATPRPNKNWRLSYAPTPVSALASARPAGRGRLRGLPRI